MNIAVTYIISLMVILVSLLTLGRDMISTFDGVVDSWTTLRTLSTEKADTRLTGPTGLSVSQGSTVEITLTNAGDIAIGRFSDWNVIFEVQKASGFEVLYLTYTDNVSPGANQWTAKGIYIDASTLTAEVTDPGILNSNEEMIILANPSPSVIANTYNRATFATPNGITAKVIFHVVP